MLEKWKKLKIDNFEILVSNIGNVKSTTRIVKIRNGTYIKKEKLLKPYIKCGYYNIRATFYNNRKTFAIHRLVLMAFSPKENIKHLQVNHKDFNRKNNILSNLEWVTSQQNVDHSVKGGRMWTEKRINMYKNIEGEKAPWAKLTNEQAMEIYNSNDNNKYLSEKYNIHNKTVVWKIKTKKSWKHIHKIL